jgi:hypothetical protein
LGIPSVPVRAAIQEEREAPNHLSKFEKLRNRRLPLEKLANRFTEEYRRATKDTDYAYLVTAMQPIANDYTEETFLQGDRVKNQLDTHLGYQHSAEFAYQGSVTSDTHIKVHSDIDLIAILGGVSSLQVGVPNPSPYAGNLLDDLRALRRDCQGILERKFPEVDIDATGGKAIALSGGSLKREIDVVIANWYKTLAYHQWGANVHRGINVLDNNTGTTIQNLPFLHNFHIDQKDGRTNTGLRKAVRLLKTLKYDAEPVLGISSYEVAALAHAMPDAELTVADGQYLKLAINVNRFLKRCIADSRLRDSLEVPNGTRKIFGGMGATLSALQTLQRELEALLNRITVEKSAAAVAMNEMANRTGFGQAVAPWAETRSRRVAAML